jgi:hypothetical protein
MTKPYELLTELAQQAEIPADGTLSRTIHQDERLKVVLFAFRLTAVLDVNSAGLDWAYPS